MDCHSWAGGQVAVACVEMAAVATVAVAMVMVRLEAMRVVEEGRKEVVVRGTSHNSPHLPHSWCIPSKKDHSC